MAIRFAYDGSAFPRGFARQPEGGTVEDALLEALGGEGFIDGSWRCGSRTDAGVSALENVAACRLERAHLDGLVPALQARLPAGVWVTGVSPAPDDWNPRYASERSYLYIALDQGERLRPMRKACRAFQGRHLMGAFARLEGGRDPEREVMAFTVRRTGGAWLFRVRAPSFLWNQVRRMVDAVLRVGRGDATPADVAAALQSGVPHPSFKRAAPEGLLLESVRYDAPLSWAPEAGAPAAHDASRLLVRSLIQAAVARHALHASRGRQGGGQGGRR